MPNTKSIHTGSNFFKFLENADGFSWNLIVILVTVNTR